MAIQKRLALLVIWIACIFSAIVSSIWMFFSILVGSDRAWNLAVAFDRLGNAATGGNVSETISSRAYRAETEGRRWGCILCKLLDYIQKDHCKNSAGT